MKNILFILGLALAFNATAQTSVTLELEGYKDAEWMCGITFMKNNYFTHQAVLCPNGKLSVDEQTLEVEIIEPGGYFFRMGSDKLDKVTLVYVEVEEGDVKTITQKVRKKRIEI